MIAPASTARTDDQIVAYFANAAEAIGRDVPFVIQDYPQSTNVVMSPGVIRRIVTENPSCVMLKHEDWPGLDKITAVRRFTAEGEMRPDQHFVRKWRAVPAARGRARRRRRHDRLRVPRNAGKFGAAPTDWRARCRARSLRFASAVAPLRTTTRTGPCGAQIRDAAARHHRLGCAEKAGDTTFGGSSRRNRRTSRATSSSPAAPAIRCAGRPRCPTGGG